MSATSRDDALTAARYAAFISYSHRDRDPAEWLHRALETYRPPPGVLGSDSPHAALRPIFIDRAELPSSSDLAASVREALSASRYLIVVCSPAAAQSRWVNEEIRFFKALGGTKRILALIVAGDPGRPPGDPEDCLPAALRYVVNAQGEITDVAGAEPLAADIRPGADERRSAMLKLAAGMLQVPLDRLVQRDTARRHRRLIQIAAGAVAGCLAFAVLSVFAVQSRNEAERQRRTAVQQSLTAQRTAGFLKSLFAVSDPSEARGQSITAREVLDRGVQQIETQLRDEPVVRADLATTLGEVYGSLGLLREGSGLIERAQSIEGLPAALQARQSAAIGDLQRQQGDLTAARNSLQRAQSLLATPGLSDASLYVSVNNALGLLYRNQDDCPAARKVYGDALRKATHQKDQDAEGWVTAQEGIAQCDMDEGNFAAADAGFQRALKRQIAVTGEMHPRAAELLNEIGSLKYLQGDRASAGRYFADTLRIDRQVLGESHPDVIFTLNNLARVLLEQRRFAEARAALEPSLRTHSEQVLATDPNMVFFVGNLALIEMGLGNYDAATTAVRPGAAQRHPEQTSDARPAPYRCRRSRVSQGRGRCRSCPSRRSPTHRRGALPG